MKKGIIAYRGVDNPKYRNRSSYSPIPPQVLATQHLYLTRLQHHNNILYLSMCSIAPTNSTPRSQNRFSAGLDPRISVIVVHAIQRFAIALSLPLLTLNHSVYSLPHPQRCDLETLILLQLCENTAFLKAFCVVFWA